MNDRWQSRAGRLFCVALAVIAGYAVLKYALGIVLPFAIAWLVALIVESLAGRSRKRFGGGIRAWRIFYVFSVWAAVAVVCALVVKRLVRQGGELISYVKQNGEAIADAIGQAVDRIMELPSRIPFLGGLEGTGGYMEGIASAVMSKVSERAGELIADLTERLITATPAVSVGVLVCVISSVYLSVDRDAIADLACGWMEGEARARIGRWARRIESGIKGFGRAYFWMYLIAFAELYAGLIILRRNYALALAAIIALIDVMPLLSGGLVLVPWGCVMIAQGEVAVGAGLIALTAVMAVVRQAVEPRLVGKGLGLHPFVSLAAMYVGLRVFGFWGTIILPMGISIVAEMLSDGKKIEERT